MSSVSARYSRQHGGKQCWQFGVKSTARTEHYVALIEQTSLRHVGSILKPKVLAGRADAQRARYLLRSSENPMFSLRKSVTLKKVHLLQHVCCQQPLSDPMVSNIATKEEGNVGERPCAEDERQTHLVKTMRLICFSDVALLLAEYR